MTLNCLTIVGILHLDQFISYLTPRLQGTTMYASLIMFVDFSAINLAPMMACVLVAMALVLPCMGVAFVISLVEEMYWVNKFSEEVPHFVLPPEIAALPLELDESKSLVCLASGEVVMPEGSVPPVRYSIDDMINKIMKEMDRPICENTLMIWS